MELLTVPLAVQRPKDSAHITSFATAFRIGPPIIVNQAFVRCSGTSAVTFPVLSLSDIQQYPAVSLWSL